VPLLFSLAVFTGAFLLFVVQPMIAKMELPHLGGAPAVWNTCMVFFQAALLAGYCYAHATSRWLGARWQGAVHLGLLALAIAFLPVGAPDSLESGRAPGLELLCQLAKRAGVPLFVVATTAPIVQRWFAVTGHRMASDPYFLYSASNAGSLLALVAYVMLVEPNLTIEDQARLWAAGYGILAGLILVCVLAVWRSGSGTPASRPFNPARPDAPTVAERVSWAALALAPSNLLLGVTAYLTTDLAPVPLLWVVPLALYLVSFVLAFGAFPARLRSGCARALPVAVVATLALILRPQIVPLWAMIMAHLCTFFLVATACHTELANRRPAVNRLTEFYLMVSLGGVMGGLLNALIAPVIFTWIAEYPLGLALAVFLVPAASDPVGHRAPRSQVALHLLDFTLPALIGLSIYGVSRIWMGRIPGWLFVGPLVACLVFVRRRLRFALSLAAVTVATVDLQDAVRHAVLRERSFFGVLRVSIDYPPGMNSLAHGNTLHGMQRRSAIPSVRRMPLMYYFPTGPIGRLFEAYQGTLVVRRIGVIGLGVGSLAAYGRAGDAFTFFEIDPAVERIARNPAYFHYLEDCRASWRVVPGDARLSLTRQPRGSFGLLVLDAFSGDAVPVHLLTREALQIYLSRLADGGLIAVHISSNYLDLGSAVASLARDAGLVCLEQNETTIPPNELSQGKMPSHWVVLARRPADLDRLANLAEWGPLAGRRRIDVWTDSHSDVFRLLRWR
jgi:hypothetical protein